MPTKFIKQSIRLATSFSFIIVASVFSPLYAQGANGSLSSDDPLKIYAVNVKHDRPTEEPFIGYGTYLGQGLVLTAAHVLGRLPAIISHPRVLISGQEFPATVVKEGSFDTIDLALLSVDLALLPNSLQLRRNPLCKEIPKAGEEVVVVVPFGTARSKIISPQLLPLRYRSNFTTFINDMWIPGGSGTGVFQAERKCLLGILSSKIWQYNYRKERGRLVRDLTKNTTDIARHFVSAAEIAEFIPPEFRF
jgi:hypothetical protein